jgi:hypothetical protein
MSDFENEILNRRMNDSDANSENFESLRKHNQIFVNNLRFVEQKQNKSKNPSVRIIRKSMGKSKAKKFPS